MPTRTPIADAATMDIVTNLSLIDNPNPSYILSGQIAGDGANDNGGLQIAFTIPQNGQAVIISHSMKEIFMKGEGTAPVHYHSRGEVQGDIKAEGVDTNAFHSAYRILRIMPALTIRQGNKEYLHLTIRGHGASDAGHWSCASSLVGAAVSPRCVYSTLNRETGLLIDGKIAVFEPSTCQDVTFNAIIDKDARGMKHSLSRKSPELAAAFARGAEFTTISTKAQFPKAADTVSFYGGLVDGDVECIAFDNPEQRTLTLAFPLVAEVPEGAVLTAFNGQGYEGPAALVEKKFLRDNCGIQLIPGLSELVLGKK